MSVTIERRRELAAKVRDVMGDLATIELDGVPLADLIEPSEADEWVDGLGGLGVLQAMCDALRDMLDWVRRSAGIGEDECVDYDELLCILDRRLMPEGMEWPRYEDGEPVRVGDEFADEFGCIDVARPICFDANAYSLDSDAGASSWVGYGERVKRPPVLAADGEPLEVGQTVWETDAESGTPMTVVEVSNDLIWCEYTWKDGKTYRPCCPPSVLTHTKPEPPDSWERVEDDATLPPGTYCERMGIAVEQGDSFVEPMARDLVRRCRALAERGE